MNKENKKLAQQKRAENRAKAEKKKKVTETLRFWGPIVAAAIVIIVLIWAVVTSNGNEAGTQDTSSQSAETTPVLNTEAGLEVEDGDKVNIDYVGYLDGEAFEGGDTKGNGADLVIGSGSYIDGFEEGLIGHTVGEEVSLELTFPEVYQNNPDMAGKDVVFEVVINGIYE